MRARGFVLLAVVIVSTLLWFLRDTDTAPRDTRRPPPVAGTDTKGEPALTGVKRSIKLSEPVDDVRVFVLPLELLDGDNAVELPWEWTTKLITRFERSLDITVPKDLERAEVLVLAPGYEPAVGELVDIVEEDLEIELVEAEPVTIEVVDEEGQPLSGAELLVYASSRLPPHERHVTGTSGKIDIFLNEGGYVHVTAPGRTREEADTDDRRVELWPAFVLAGRVVDTADNALGGVQLQLVEGVFDMVRSSFKPHAVTDPDGVFRFENVSHGECQISAMLDGYLPGGFYGWPGEDNLEIKLLRPGSIAGRVLGGDAAGDRVEGRIGPLIFAAMSGGRIAEDGSFLLTDIYPHEFTLEVKTKHFIGTIPVEVTEGAQLRGVQIPMQPREARESFVRLRLFGPDGRPRPGVTVWPATPEVTTDGKGEARISYPVDPMEWIVLYMQDEGLPPHEVAAYTRSSKDTTIVEVKLPEWKEVIIRLQPPGKELLVQHGYFGALRWVVKERTDVAAGLFVFRLNPELRYKLTLDQKPLHDWTYPKGGRTDITLGGKGVLWLRFVDAAGKPVRDVTVRARDGKRALRKGKLQEDRGFLLDNLEPGEVRVAAGRHKDVPEMRLVAMLAAGETKELPPIRLPGYRWLTGTVTDTKGKPVGGAAIEVEGDRTGYTERGATAATRADGTFRIRVSGDAKGFLRVWKDGFGVVAVSEAISAPHVVLPPAGMLELTVPARLSLLSFEQALPLTEGGWYWAKLEDSSVRAKIIIENVAAGELRLRLPGGERVFKIEAGKTTRAALR